jgi:hypothetical protein
MLWPRHPSSLLKRELAHPEANQQDPTAITRCSFVSSSAGSVTVDVWAASRVAPTNSGLIEESSGRQQVVVSLLLQAVTLGVFGLLAPQGVQQGTWNLGSE